MSIMKFESQGAYFEMSVVIEADKSIQSHGDAYLTVRILSNGFSGQNDLWVSGKALSAFRTSLTLLEQSLQGEATLESISPDELKLRIFSVNKRGHLAVEGNTGYWSQSQEGSFWHSISFGFTFEPQQLTQGLSVSWVQSEKQPSI